MKTEIVKYLGRGDDAWKVERGHAFTSDDLRLSAQPSIGDPVILVTLDSGEVFIAPTAPLELP